MKKLSILLVLVMLCSILAMPVLAAQSATLTLSASKSNVCAGDTFTVTVSVSAVKECFNGGFLFDFDKEIFEYVDGTAFVDNYAIFGVSTINDLIAGYFMSQQLGYDIEGDLFQITLKVKDTAPLGSYTISGIPSITVLNNGAKEEISSTSNDLTITVVEKGAVVLGDANGDGKVNLRDAIMVLQASNGKDITIDRTAADVNGDGKVNLQDAIRILKRANGNKDPFPAEK